MAFEEYYLSKTPAMYHKNSVMNYLKLNKLLFMVNVRMDMFAMENSSIDYVKYANDLTAHHLAEKIMEEQKMVTRIIDNPVYQEKILEATAILITPDELMKLMYDFGIRFAENPNETR